ncbi:hypothetical protein SAMN04487785_11687 [Dyella jiangningensis]|uniref:hypothetical protein n=1 Tax=Dyella sp. AtDHG13 TaxID=1938897 RepID=UPI000884C522|nr:hypothetical protein [Dyella sp. AtDHG13]PXV53626.1 hypothetical protein BDW41_11434 [Dyella sp. AtDHG13]SDL23610.1 hypothetical protein SAMN04487785_11687 [Dyella jiangningensis]
MMLSSLGRRAQLTTFCVLTVLLSGCAIPERVNTDDARVTQFFGSYDIVDKVQVEKDFANYARVTVGRSNADDLFLLTFWLPNGRPGKVNILKGCRFGGPVASSIPVKDIFCQRDDPSTLTDLVAFNYASEPYELKSTVMLKVPSDKPLQVNDGFALTYTIGTVQMRFALRRTE